MKKLLLSLLLVGSSSQLDALAGSLYKVESSPFASFIAREAGDILTIIVDEWSDTNDQGSREHKRESEAGFSISDFFFPGFNLQNGFSATKGSGDSPAVKWESGSESKNSSSNNSKHTFETKLEVRLIEEIRPGQFLIRGQRMVNINGKERTIFLSGVIRQRDITPFNTIRSHQVADAHVEIIGEVGGRDVRDGFLQKAYNFIF